MVPTGKLGAPRRIVLRPAKALGFVGTEKRGDGSIRPSQTPLRRLIPRPLPRWRDSQDAAFSFDHDIAGIAGCRRYERKSMCGSRSDPSADHFCARSRLAEAAARQHEPNPPLSIRRRLIGPGPEGPLVEQRPRFCGGQSGDEVAPRQLRSRAKRSGVQAPGAHPLEILLYFEGVALAANAGRPAIARGLISCAALLRETGSGRRKRSNLDGADTKFRPLKAPAHRPAGGAVPSSLGVDVVPFPTLANVQQLYHFDPELTIHKYHFSKPGIQQNAPRAYPMRQSGCRKPPPDSRAARSSPVRAPTPSTIAAIRSRAIHTNRRLSPGRQPQGWHAKPSCAHSRFGTLVPPPV